MATHNNSFQPLKVTIVGAGIAGLTAAIALRKNGHIVQVFEAHEIKTEIGAALGVQVNSLSVLDHLGVSRDNLKGITFSGNVIFSPEGGEGATYRWLVPAANENPGLLCHRSDLYEELKRLAIGEGENPPVKLHLGYKIVACDPEEGTITLNSGLHEIPELEWLTAGISGTRSIIPKDGPFRMMFVYPCRNGSLINFVGFYTNSPDEEAKWTPTASREEIIEKFKDFHPKFLRLLDVPIHSDIHKWQLRVLPLLPSWIRGRAALLGDAAHATLPLLGQGAGMAIEEAGALGCLLPAGTRREDIPARLAAYQDLRKLRGEFVKTESVEQVARILDGGEFLRSQGIQDYIFKYDTLKAAQDVYEERFGHVGAVQVA
ncbi:hypothetical protein C8R44DRAFT_883009 [Mycena epipterygia]|nr:hypothetical protein C8R44DRAFT_883009 [Mycena epipterygia]